MDKKHRTLQFYIGVVIIYINAIYITISTILFSLCWLGSEHLKIVGIVFILPNGIAWIGIKPALKRLQKNNENSREFWRKFIVGYLGVIVLSQFTFIVIKFVMTPIPNYCPYVIDSLFQS